MSRRALKGHNLSARSYHLSRCYEICIAAVSRNPTPFCAGKIRDKFSEDAAQRRSADMQIGFEHVRARLIANSVGLGLQHFTYIYEYNV